MMSWVGDQKIGQVLIEGFWRNFEISRVFQKTLFLNIFEVIKIRMKILYILKNKTLIN